MRGSKRYPCVESFENRRLLAVDPVSLAELGQFGGSANDVATAGQYAFVGNGKVLTTINVSSPTSPTFVSRLTMPDSVRGISVAGNYAYCACGDAGLQVVDISNTSSPQIIGAFNDIGISLDVFVQGNYAYIANTRYFDVVNVSNPAVPTLAGRVQPSTSSSTKMNSIAISGSTAILGDLFYGMRIFSIASPTNPVLLGSYALASNNSYGVAFAPQTGYALLGNVSSGMDIINISAPSTPAKVTSIALSTAQAIQVIGTRAYVASSLYGLQIVELSNLAAPTLVTTIGDVFQRTTAISVSNGQAWLASDRDGLFVTPVATPSIIRSISLIVSTSFVRASTVVGTRLYLLSDVGLDVIDVSNPSNPQRLGRRLISTQVYDIAVAGNYAYIANGSTGVLVYNISNPAAITSVTTYNTPGTASGLALEGQRLYVADGSNGLLILNIAAATPTLLGSLDTPGTASDVSVVNALAAVADFNAIKVIDCTNAASPQLRSTMSATLILDVLFAGSTLYAGGFDVRAYSLDDPSNPVLLASATSNLVLYELAVSGSLLLAATQEGMSVWDVHMQTATNLVGSFGGAVTTGSITAGICASGDYVYLANNDAGARMVRIDRPVPTVLTKAYRDDFGQSIEFQFDQTVNASIDPSDLSLLNITSGQTYSGGVLALTNTVAGTLARWKPLSAALLPDGNYLATIEANAVENTIGTTLASQIVFNFTVLRGDVNHDKSVNFDDLLTLAQNYGQTGRTFSQGNVDYSPDGSVNFDDLLTLAQRYGVSLASSSQVTKTRRDQLDLLR